MAQKIESSDQIEVELHVEASPEIVFSYFTEADKYSLWMGEKAEIEPEPGGIFRVSYKTGDVAEGEFVELDPPKRLVFTWGWVNNELTPPGSSRVEVDLAEKDGGTDLRLTHNGLPEDGIKSHTEGWDHFLGQLVEAVKAA
jgi:uncharacterized protein YndB with AHSA1/START domain